MSNRYQINEIIQILVSLARVGPILFDAAATGFTIAAGVTEVLGPDASDFLEDHLAELEQARDHLKTSVHRCVLSSGEAFLAAFPPRQHPVIKKNLERAMRVWVNPESYHESISKLVSPELGHGHVLNSPGMLFLAAVTTNPNSKEIFEEEMSYDNFWGSPPEITGCDENKAAVSRVVIHAFRDYIIQECDFIDNAWGETGSRGNSSQGDRPGYQLPEDFPPPPRSHDVSQVVMEDVSFSIEAFKSGMEDIFNTVIAQLDTAWPIPEREIINYPGLFARGLWNDSADIAGAILPWVQNVDLVITDECGKFTRDMLGARRIPRWEQD